ncbi:MAG: DUF1080 domain-containing protein [Armatimonadetes bacterium]|nr:DUF1080 domain-containing protein [Armatimonadota bacterium]MBS1701903.1 DUF1080 domain-containing protein [Armatimonadota bacterium]MBS1728259.1 DUF1080 domain-containing protein [Armatimonadota bacterium]
MGFSRRDVLSRLSATAGGFLLGGLVSRGAEAQGYDDTPMLPGGHWRVHDSKRPQPTVITPGAVAGAAPSDAVVLFGGKDLSMWKSGEDAAKWKVAPGEYFESTRGTGNIRTRDEFGDCQLHVEFCEPNPPKGSDQGRGNSGIFLFGRYEIQVLDCFENKTYADGMTGSIYGQTPPLVNACRKPGTWETYDIVFVGPRFDGDKLVTPALATVFLNGVLVQHATPLIGSTQHRQVGKYEPHGPKGALELQDHGDPVRYRNIWIREIGPHAEVYTRAMNSIG